MDQGQLFHSFSKEKIVLVKRQTLLDNLTSISAWKFRTVGPDKKVSLGDLNRFFITNKSLIFVKCTSNNVSKLGEAASVESNKHKTCYTSRCTSAIITKITLIKSIDSYDPVELLIWITIEIPLVCSEYKINIFRTTYILEKIIFWIFVKNHNKSKIHDKTEIQLLWERKLCHFPLKYKLFINSDWWVISGSKDYFMFQLIDAFWNQINCTCTEMKNNPSTAAHNLCQMTSKHFFFELIKRQKQFS